MAFETGKAQSFKELGVWQDLWGQLKTQQNLWQHSLLQAYPKSLEHYPDGYIRELQCLDELELYHFDAGGKLDALLELKKIFAPLQKIIAQVPIHQKRTALSPVQKSGLKLKKIHEIEAILALLEQYRFSTALPVIDWGGGQGHLAASLSHYAACQVYSLDRNQLLQNKGQDRYGSHVNFIRTDLKLNTPCTSLAHSLPKLDKEHGSIALHACGSLSLVQLSYARQSPCQWLVNLGCCYHYLDPSQTMISQAASSFGYQISPSALDLASRTRARKSLQHFRLKQQVNYYRWAVHLFLYHELGVRDFKETGRFSDRIYQSDFSQYAELVASRLQLGSEERKQLQRYFAQDKIQKYLHKIFLIHLIRWQFARALELAIVADRAQWLAEAGFQSQVIQLFDSALSPRNLGIVARM